MNTFSCAIVLSLLSVCAAAQTVPPEIEARTLANGLRIIVWPDHDIPNVVMYNYVKAGGRNEYPGITGLSHFFEHMMFNGTSRRAPGEFDREMEAAGGANNAYTSNDVTVYQDWLPRSALEVVLDLEADRLENLTSDPEIIESERGVVYSERRLRVDNSNFGRLYEQVRATAFVAHPYQFPVIGWPSDIENWTGEDLATYFKTYYAPNNLTIVFSGDVTAAEAFGLAEKYLAPIPSQPAPPPVRTVEPPQQGERRIVVEKDAQTPLLHFAYHAGAASDPDSQALNLLLNILTAGESSRLHRALVEDEELAISVDSFFQEGFDPGLVYFYLTLPQGGDIALAEQRFRQELQHIVDIEVTESELEKARNIVLADFWRGLATIDGKAAALGEFEVFRGGHEKLFQVPADLDRVTAEDLQSVAKKVFRSANVTVGILRSAVSAEESS